MEKKLTDIEMLIESNRMAKELISELHRLRESNKELIDALEDLKISFHRMYNIADMPREDYSGYIQKTKQALNNAKNLNHKTE